MKKIFFGMWSLFLAARRPVVPKLGLYALVLNSPPVRGAGSGAPGALPVPDGLLPQGPPQGPSQGLSWTCGLDAGLLPR